MDVRAAHGAIQEAQADAIIINIFQDTEPGGATKAVDDALSGSISELVESGEFRGKVGQVAVLYPREAIPARRVILVGLGQQSKFNLEGVRRAIAPSIKKANALKAAHVATILHGAGTGSVNPADAAQAIAEASHMALYNYHGKKSKDAPETAVKILDVIVFDESDLEAVKHGIQVGNAYAAGVALTRDLVNHPPNICTPSFLAKASQDMAGEVGLKVDVLEEKQMSTLKMGALLAVAQGSDTPPRFIILEHNADRADELDTIVLVGKGVTFDTGGYSIKSRDGMVGMKSDMAGGGAVIGAMKAIATLDLPLHVVGLIPASDNMVSGNAYRPEEVFTASNGISIEIISTDAEGRLLLADALVFASRYKPAAVVDIATLTGSCMVALGAVAAGLFSNNDDIRDKLLAAGTATHERVWPLPMFEEYNKGLESQTADTKNSATRWGGASVAALFLKNFVDYPAWAHVDMAGMESDIKDIPYISKGATGYGVRLLAEFVRRWAQQ